MQRRSAPTGGGCSPATDRPSMAASPGRRSRHRVRPRAPGCGRRHQDGRDQPHVRVDRRPRLRGMPTRGRLGVARVGIRLSRVSGWASDSSRNVGRTRFGLRSGIGEWPSGKAPDSGSGDRRFESFLASQYHKMSRSTSVNRPRPPSRRGRGHGHCREQRAVPHSPVEILAPIEEL